MNKLLFLYIFVTYSMLCVSCDSVSYYFHQHLLFGFCGFSAFVFSLSASNCVRLNLCACASLWLQLHTELLHAYGLIFLNKQLHKSVQSHSFISCWVSLWKAVKL